MYLVFSRVTSRTVRWCIKFITVFPEPPPLKKIIIIFISVFCHGVPCNIYIYTVFITSAFSVVVLKIRRTPWEKLNCYCAMEVLFFYCMKCEFFQAIKSSWTDLPEIHQGAVNFVFLLVVSFHLREDVLK